VLALDSVGLPAFFDVARRGGLVFPDNPNYGLAVTLGGADARLIDLTGAYATLANAGVQLTPTLITRVEDNNGLVLWDAQTSRKPRQAYTPEHAYLITHMLADNDARIKTFGANSVLRTARPAAVKTGTTNDTRDNLAVGYTPDLVVGVWAGNTDNTPMRNVSGVEGAAPIWRQIIDTALRGKPALQFARPAGIIEAEVCVDGGQMPSENCPANRRVKEIFKVDQGPLPANEWVERAVRAGDPRAGTPPPATAAPAPTTVVNQPNEIIITSPPDGGVMARQVFGIRGIVNPPGFERYQVEWGVGDSPGEWKWISGPHLSPVIDDQMSQWSTEGLPAGRYTIRVTAFTSGGRQVYGYSRFEVR
jgi:membrane peptidoglycan carboxypeptidase